MGLQGFKVEAFQRLTYDIRDFIPTAGVSIQWRSKDESALRMEDWCRALYSVQGTYYLAPVTMTTRQREDIWGAADFSN